MSAVAAPSPVAPRRGKRFRTLRRFVRHPGALAGSIVLVVIVFMALFAPWIVPYDWNET
ncbi:MAG: ABC transporter permease, partial [Alsobacter sp.]